MLEVLRATANVTKAAQAIGVSRQTAHDWRAQDVQFAKAWDDAINTAMEAAEGELYRRAVEGTLKPVFYQGGECGEIREYSDTLLMFMLKGHKPEKYRDVVEQKQSGEVVLKVQYGEDGSKGTDD